jgi:hypothetical protein
MIMMVVTVLLQIVAAFLVETTLLVVALVM